MEFGTNDIFSPNRHLLRRLREPYTLVVSVFESVFLYYCVGAGGVTVFSVGVGGVVVLCVGIGVAVGLTCSWYGFS